MFQYSNMNLNKSIASCINQFTVYNGYYHLYELYLYYLVSGDVLNITCPRKKFLLHTYVYKKTLDIAETKRLILFPDKNAICSSKPWFTSIDIWATKKNITPP